MLAADWLLAADCLFETTSASTTSVLQPDFDLVVERAVIRGEEMVLLETVGADLWDVIAGTEHV